MLYISFLSNILYKEDRHIISISHCKFFLKNKIDIIKKTCYNKCLMDILHIHHLKIKGIRLDMEYIFVI